MQPTESNDYFTSHFSRRRVMVILRGYDTVESVDLAQRAWDSGIPLVEVPLQSAQAREAIAALAQLADGRNRVVGAGTILTPELAAQAVDAGAAFTVAPGLNRTTVEASLALGMPHLPGVGTMTEVQMAVEMGLSWVKAFPADALGTRWVSGARGPFPDIGIVATGGVGASNAAEFLAAGASAVSLGASFASLQGTELAAIGAM